MIQIIGIMIGAYIGTRAQEILASKEHGMGIKISALFTLVISTLGTIALAGSSLLPSMPDISKLPQ